jgi:hypothetical protein
MQRRLQKNCGQLLRKAVRKKNKYVCKSCSSWTALFIYDRMLAAKELQECGKRLNI